MTINQLKVDDLEILPPAMAVLRAGAYVALTSIEFSLLAELTALAGQVVDRDELSQKVLGRPYSPADRSLDNHICHLCKKLGPAVDGRRRVLSIRSKGYMYRRFQPSLVESHPENTRVQPLRVAVSNAPKTQVRAARRAV